MLQINDNDCQSSKVTNALSVKNSNLFSPMAQMPANKKGKEKKAMLMLDDYHSAANAQINLTSATHQQ